MGKSNVEITLIYKKVTFTLTMNTYNYTVYRDVAVSTLRYKLKRHYDFVFVKNYYSIMSSVQGKGAINCDIQTLNLHFNKYTWLL